MRNGGIGSVLYILRDNKMCLGGYFSAKLKPHQIKWLPCEVEALAISSSVNHWGPHIIESNHQTQVLTDSKPCIQAYEKLSRGEFSSSARISTFLSTLSRYHISMQHISGVDNLPADYLSRNPMECDNGACQICSFVSDCQQATIHRICVSDVLDGKSPMPFTNPNAWKKTQQDCSVLRRTFSHLSQGTRPTKKMTNIRDIKRYLQAVTIGTDNLLVVKKQIPFSPARDLIVIPQHVINGLLTALHLRLQHPSKLQLKTIFHRYFCALDADKLIDEVSSKCAQCASLAKLPREIAEFSTTYPPDRPGVRLACDVMCRARQKVFVIRDVFSSFTAAVLLPNEQKEALRTAIIETTVPIKAASGATIRVDGAPGFQSLLNDSLLNKLGIALEVGRVKNINKNPVAEKAIQELETELKKLHPEGGPISASDLVIAVTVLNARVRNSGLSSREILFQRDNLTGEQLNITDAHLAENQYARRLQNHVPSATSQRPRGKLPQKASVIPGDLVYLKQDGDKHTGRERYIVTSCNAEYVNVKKLVGSQLRAKEYQVKYTDIYPVPSVKLPFSSASKHHQSSPYDSQSSDETDDDSDISDVYVCNPQEPDPSADNTQRRYPARARKPPAWMQTGEWVT